MGDKTGKTKVLEDLLEVEANQFTIKCMYFTAFGILVCWLMNYFRIFIVDMTLMTRGLSSIIFILVPTLICRFVDLKKPWIKYMLLFGMCAAIAVQGISLTYHTVIMTLLPMFLSLQYSKKRMIYYTYFLSVLGIATVVFGGYYFGLCDANMVTLTTGPTREYVNFAEGTVHFELANTMPMITLPLFFILPRSLMLLLFLPLMRKISRNISKTAVRLSEVQKEAEEDRMTSVYNKNKYLDMVENVYPEIAQVGVIFWDINNLKETNDVLGHHSGDYLITCTAYLLRALLEPNRKIYRVGGDEFVMIVENPQEDEMEQIMARWQDAVQVHNQLERTSISVATGYATGEGKNIKAVIDAADQAMYENKKKIKNAE